MNIFIIGNASVPLKQTRNIISTGLTNLTGWACEKRLCLQIPREISKQKQKLCYFWTSILRKTRLFLILRFFTRKKKKIRRKTRGEFKISVFVFFVCSEFIVLFSFLRNHRHKNWAQSESKWKWIIFFCKKISAQQ